MQKLSTSAQLPPPPPQLRAVILGWNFEIVSGSLSLRNKKIIFVYYLMTVWRDYLHCNTSSLVSLTLCWSILHLQQSADPICFRWWPSTYLPLPTLQLKVWFCAFSAIFINFLFLPPPPRPSALSPSVTWLCPSSKWNLNYKFLNLHSVVWF